MTNFADRLSKLVQSRGPICAGIDPRQDAMPPDVSMVDWGIEVARVLGSRVATVKPQLAFFDDDWRKVERVAVAARDDGALVIADCKRGDIDTTARAYAERILGKDSPFDAATVNPYLGRDALMPFVEVAAKNGKGLFVLVRTSNPGAKDLQTLRVADSGLAVSEVIAGLVHDIGVDLVGDCGLSLVGAVVGLTVDAAEVQNLRRFMPFSPFLMPGWGAQGGNGAAFLAATRGYPPGAAVINASRSLTLPWKGPAPVGWHGHVLDALEQMNREVAALDAGK